MKTTMAAKRRVQFVFPDRTIEKLDQLKEQLGASSRTEVVKTAIELLCWVGGRLAKGEEIAAVRGAKISETIAIPGALSHRLSNGGSSQ